MDWPVFICALVGAVLGTIFKDFAQGFLREKGKQLATREDIEKVLEKVRRVTEETENIKAEIGSNRWIDQQIWIKRWEIYSAILDLTTRLIRSVSFYTALWNRKGPEFLEQENEIRVCTKEIIHHVGNVNLLCNEVFVKEYMKFGEALKNFPLFSKDHPSKLNVDFMDEFIELIVENQKRDLKFPGVIEKPS